MQEVIRLSRSEIFKKLLICAARLLDTLEYVIHHVMTYISGAAPGLSEDGCPSRKIQGFIPIFPKRKLGCIQNKENFDIFF